MSYHDCLLSKGLGIVCKQQLNIHSIPLTEGLSSLTHCWDFAVGCVHADVKGTESVDGDRDMDILGMPSAVNQSSLL